MAESRITLQRRRFVEALGESTRITFSDLKSKLVSKNGMNLATLYRIVDAFRNQGLIHEMTVAGERVIFPCQCESPSTADSVTISFCENCGAIYDVHAKLANPYLSSETFARMKSCRSCMLG